VVLSRKSAAAAVALLAAALLATPQAAAAARPRARSTAARSAVAPASAVSGRCSRATATALLLLVHVGEPPRPVGQVLCGHFVGPRSTAMAASGVTPGCGGTIGWAVFRRVGTVWRLVMLRNNGARLDALGPRIRETHFVLRPGDPHCFPTGGTVSRVWHWTGRGFTHTAYRRSGAMFVSPSRNLWCVISLFSVICQSTVAPHTATLTNGGRLRTCTGTACFTMGSQPASAALLPYGRALSVGGFRCQSQPAGMTCVLRRTGHGFTIDRTATTRV
jgi:hypothetical protein